MAVRSRVFRAYCRSKVRIPRSQRMTLGLPAARMYSAAIRQSSIVADIPHFSRTGLPISPTRFNSEKFCILRAPIWIMSATSTTFWRAAVSISSVTIPKPVASRAEDIQLMPLHKVWLSVQRIRIPLLNSFT